MVKHRDWEGKPSLRDSWIQEGIEKGIEKGREEGLRSMIANWHKRGLPKENALSLVEPQYHTIVGEIYGSDKPFIKDLNLD